MEWARAFGPDREPGWEEIAGFIANPLWEDLNGFLKESYRVEPRVGYSMCSGQPGWNIKYLKGGRSLCTLYPMDGFFIALVVIGNKEQVEAELMLPTLTGYVRGLMESAAAVMGGRWLMIHVSDAEVLGDVKRLIQLRRPIQQIKPK